MKKTEKKAGGAPLGTLCWRGRQVDWGKHYLIFEMSSKMRQGMHMCVISCDVLDASGNILQGQRKVKKRNLRIGGSGILGKSSLSITR